MDEIFIDPMIEAPLDCEDTTEYDNRIDDNSEIEPEEEPEDQASHYKREEKEQQFARYERNYRARRLRELTLTPVTQVRQSNRVQSKKIAA